MISLRSRREIEFIKVAAKISAQALKLAGEFCVEGISTWEIDRRILEFIESEGATSNFLNYGGYPAASCISVNDIVIHGVPSKNVILKRGDVVSVDVGANFEGYNGDNAYTFVVGEVSDEISKLLRVTKNSLKKGIENAIVGNRIGDISSAIEQSIQPYGYGIVKEFVGHGVGQKLHEDPEIPNYGVAHKGPRIEAGMVFAIEPMVNLKLPDVVIDEGEWEVKTVDGAVSAHFEHTVLVTTSGPEILTKC